MSEAFRRRNNIIKMKNKLLYIIFMVISVLFCACSNSDDFEQLTKNDEEVVDENVRLHFLNEEDLENAISNTTEKYTRSIGSFRSLLSLHNTRNANAEACTYYDELGMDTLIPNKDFARLFNYKAELEVGEFVIRVTKLGTFKYAKSEEAFVDSFVSKNDKYFVANDTVEFVSIKDNVLLYNTFGNSYDDENSEDLAESYIEDDTDDCKTTRAENNIPEPDIESFPSWGADRHTIVGGWIQSIIGGTKTYTVNFNSKRRVRGSFYFYNYGVYAEIGVKGWTDKKNWIGWSKTESDELRVGWNSVVIQIKANKNYNSVVKNMNDFQRIKNANVNMGSNNIYSADVLYMPEIKSDLKNKIITKGIKGLYDLAKKYGYKPSEMEKKEAMILASRTEIYFIAKSECIKKYNTKYYCHVFSKRWMSFEISYSNKTGFSFNGINQYNYNKASAWANSLKSAIDENNSKSLVGGEVYVCARFGNNWKGMKITK